MTVGEETGSSGRRRLPPLTSLRAFEAVARHLSVTNAADELAVTPAAVSQQLRQLEDLLGTALVRKQGRNLALTDAGRALQPGLSEGFDRLAKALTDMRPAADARPAVRVAVAPSFADKWLIPRLGGFIANHPGIDIYVTAAMALVDFARDPVDLAIRFGAGRYTGLTVEKLCPEEVFPVCAPSLLTKDPPLKSIQDLQHVTLIHDDNPAEKEGCPDWELWLSMAGHHDIPAQAGPRFNQSSMALNAATHGVGVALAKGFLAKDDLESGRLVRPFPGDQPLKFAYWTVSTPHALDRPEVQRFQAWLKAEANQH